MVHILAAPNEDFGKPLHAGQAATAAYLFVIFLGLPLVMHKGYFDITETKHLYFLSASALYVLTELLLWLCGRRAVLPFMPVKALRAADIGLGLFALCSIAGALLFGGAGAWFAPAGRYQGVATILAYALVYLCISRNFCFTRLNVLGLFAGLGLSCLLAVMNDFGLDPLRAVAALSAKQRWQFVSTLGNTNFYSAFLGALLPLPLTIWCFAEKRRWQFLSGLALLCGFAGMLPSASESFTLALLTTLWLLPPFLARRPRAFRRYLAALIGMALTLGLLRGLMSFLPTTQYLSASMRLLTHPAALGLIALICGVLLIALRKRNAPLFSRRAYFLVSLVLFLLSIVFMILRNTALRGLSFGYADRFLLLNESWGTDRGRIWAYCLEAFRSAGPLQKLIGGGPECLLRYALLHPLFPDAYLDSAHNEYLQYLLNAGILGLGGYVTLLCGAAAAAFKRTERSPLALASILGALAYAAQALVNIAQPISTPYLFLLLGMAAGCVARVDTD